jgi:hypothetical protein
MSIKVELLEKYASLSSEKDIKGFLNEVILALYEINNASLESLVKSGVMSEERLNAKQEQTNLLLNQIVDSIYENIKINNLAKKAKATETLKKENETLSGKVDRAIEMLKEKDIEIEKTKKATQNSLKKKLQIGRDKIIAIAETSTVLGEHINDEESITNILNDFGSLAEDRNINIWMALHQNPSKKEDADDLKMRGWAGTEYGNKVSDTLVSIKSKTQNGVTFTVKQQDARDKDMDDWKFEVTDDAGLLGVPRIITKGTNLSSKSETMPQCDDTRQIREWIEQAKDQYEWPMSRKDIKTKVFGEIGGQKNDGKQQADLMAAINCGFLEESTVKSGGYYMLQPPADLPF